MLHLTLEQFFDYLHVARHALVLLFSRLALCILGVTKDVRNHLVAGVAVALRGRAKLVARFVAGRSLSVEKR